MWDIVIVKDLEFEVIDLNAHCGDKDLLVRSVENKIIIKWKFVLGKF